jgi:DnaK suppressor protein
VNDEVAIESIRRTLLNERVATNGTLRTLNAELNGLWDASVDSNGDDEHDPEGSTIAFEGAHLDALRQRAEEHLVEIDQAVKRLDAGTYGVCERCGQPIGDARLTVLPATELCVRCAAASR